jgi:hypothetical protein
MIRHGPVSGPPRGERREREPWAPAERRPATHGAQTRAGRRRLRSPRRNSDRGGLQLTLAPRVRDGRNHRRGVGRRAPRRRGLRQGRHGRALRLRGAGRARGAPGDLLGPGSLATAPARYPEARTSRPYCAFGTGCARSPLRRRRAGEFALVTHHMPIASAAAAALSEAGGAAVPAGVCPNGSITTLESEDGERWRLVAWGDARGQDG